MLPDVDGIELVQPFKEHRPEAEVIVITGQGNIPRSVEAGEGRRVLLPREAASIPTGLLDKLEKADQAASTSATRTSS